jgi:hypothetical protein
MDSSPGAAAVEVSGHQTGEPRPPLIEEVAERFESERPR